MHKQRLFIVVAAAVGILSAFLPWWKVAFFGISGSITGIDNGDGWLSFALCATAGGLAAAVGDRIKVLEGSMKKTIGGIGAGLSVFMLFELIRPAMGASSSYGMILSLLAGIAIMAIPFVIKGDGNFQMPTKDSIKDDLK